MDKRKQRVLCAALLALALLVVGRQWVAAQHTRGSRKSWDDLIARAHGAGPHGAPHAGPAGHPGGTPPPQRMTAMLDAVVERLELTPAQRRQVQPARRQFEQRLTEIAGAPTLSGKERHARMMEAWFTLLKTMETDLDPEQRDVLQRLQAMFRKRIVARQRSER